MAWVENREEIFLRQEHCMSMILDNSPPGQFSTVQVSADEGFYWLAMALFGSCPRGSGPYIRLVVLVGDCFSWALFYPVESCPSCCPQTHVGNGCCFLFRQLHYSLPTG